MATKGLDSFTTFLDYMNKAEAARGGLRPSPGSSGSPSGLRILAALSQAPSCTLPVAELLTASGMTFTDFGKAIDSFRNAALIEFVGPAEDAIRLTESGASVAKVA
jgi:DNA-binding MarR family transcriptional regulator